MMPAVSIFVFTNSFSLSDRRNSMRCCLVLFAKGRPPSWDGFSAPCGINAKGATRQARKSRAGSPLVLAGWNHSAEIEASQIYQVTVSLQYISTNHSKDWKPFKRLASWVCDRAYRPCTTYTHRRCRCVCLLGTPQAPNKISMR